MDNQTNIPQTKNAKENAVGLNLSGKQKKYTFAFLILLVIISALGIALSKYNPNRIAVNYAASIVLGDTYTADKLSVYENEAAVLQKAIDVAGEEKAYELLSFVYGTKIRNLSDIYKANREKTEEELVQKFGKYQIETTITESKNVDVSEFLDENQKRCTSLEEKGYFNSSKLSAVKTITVRVVIIGEKEYKASHYDVTLCKTGLTWKVFHHK